MKIKVALSVFIVAIMGTSGLSMAEPNNARFKPGDKNIAEIATSDPNNFSTLVAALVCTDLVGAVSNPYDELTVFAPTNAAFAVLNLDASNICNEFDTATLTTILLYHVTGERRPSPSIINGFDKSVDMLAGGSIYPDGGGSLTIRDNGDNPVQITTPDVLASNGIIHVVDHVLLP
ncbi:MAG: fasciclin domain-containing protein [Oceanospirillaceae bacterium]|nr:fasciclin domain-containing protein [Oceanospirillaceae bacterium]